MKRPDELINCPQCGKPQSRNQYEDECCWDCGCIRPLPARASGILYPVRLDNGLQDVELDEATASHPPAETGPEEHVDERRIRKMRDI